VEKIAPKGGVGYQLFLGCTHCPISGSGQAMDEEKVRHKLDSECQSVC